MHILHSFKLTECTFNLDIDELRNYLQDFLFDIYLWLDQWIIYLLFRYIMSQTQEKQQQEPTLTIQQILMNRPQSPYQKASANLQQFFTVDESGSIKISQIKHEFQLQPTKINCCIYEFNPSGEQYYTCQECCYNENYSYMCFCKKCFDPEKHIGHSYNTETSYSDQAYCDCGRSSRIKKQSFCNEHSADPIVVEFEPEKKQKFINFFQPLFKISFYLRQMHEKHTHLGLSLVGQQLMDKVVNILKQLIKGSVYYTRLTLEILKTQIQFMEDKITMLQAWMREFTCARVLFYMCADLQSLKYLAKVYIQEIAKEKINSYTFGMLKGQISSNYEVLKEMSEENMYLKDEIKSYLKFCKMEGDEANKLFEKALRQVIKIKQKQSNFSYFMVDEFEYNTYPPISPQLDIQIIQKLIKKTLNIEEEENKDDEEEQKQVKSDNQEPKQEKAQNKQEEANKEETQKKQQTENKIQDRKQQSTDQVQKPEEDKKETEGENKKQEQQVEEKKEGQSKEENDKKQNEEKKENEEENKQEESKKQDEQKKQDEEKKQDGQKEEGEGQVQQKKEEDDSEDGFYEDYHITSVISLICKRIQILSKHSPEKIMKFRDEFKLKEPENFQKFLLVAVKYVFEYICDENKPMHPSIIFMLVMNSPKKDVIFNKFWRRLMKKYSDPFDLCNNFFQALATIGVAPAYFYKQIQNIAVSEQLTQKQQQWFKNFLYERKQIEVSDMWNKKDYGLLDFESAGSILKEHTIYSEDLETFIYTSSSEYPDICLRIPYRSYVGSYNSLAGMNLNINSTMSFSCPWQAQILKELFMSDKFLSKFKPKWDENYSNNRNNDTWIESKMGHLYLLMIVLAHKYTEGENKQVAEYVEKLRKSPESRLSFNIFASEEGIEKLLCVEKGEEKSKKKEEKSKKVSEDAKRKAEEKKKKLKEKYKKNRELILEKHPSKVESMKEEEEEDLCILCHEKERANNNFVYLSSVMKNTICSSVYGEDNKSGTLLNTCFHCVHINCYAKMDGGLQTTCPLCSKGVNCIFPAKFDPKSTKLNRMCSNIIIATMVSAYRILDTENNFILLFKHLLQSKGLNSLVSITRYGQQKLFREKVDSYFQNLLREIYKTASEEQQQNYAETIKNLLDQVKTCKNQYLAAIQEIIIIALFSYIKDGKTLIDEEKLKWIKKHVQEEEYLIVAEELEELCDEVIVIDEEEEMVEKVSTAFNLPKMPINSKYFHELGHDKCDECGKAGKYSICLLCREISCRSCSDNEKHAKKHNQNRLYFQFDQGYVYCHTIFEYQSECIYINAFQMKYDQRKKDVYDLDEDKLAKVINKFFST